MTSRSGGRSPSILHCRSGCHFSSMPGPPDSPSEMEHPRSACSNGGPGIQEGSSMEKGARLLRRQMDKGVCHFRAWRAISFDAMSSRWRKAFAKCKRLSPSGGHSIEGNGPPGLKMANAFVHLEDLASQETAPQASQGIHLSPSGGPSIAGNGPPGVQSQTPFSIWRT